MPNIPEAAFLKSSFNVTTLLVAIVSALVTFSITTGSYQNKIDTLISDHKEDRVVMSQLTSSLNNLALEVTRLRQQMEDLKKK